jgi:hypothetical protein
MKLRIKWLGEKISEFLKEEHTYAELVDMLRSVQDECEIISQIGDSSF